MDQFKDIFLNYLSQGGAVMLPIALGNFVMWYALGVRFYTLRRGTTRSVRDTVERYKAGTDRKPKGMIDNAVVMGLKVVAEKNKRRRKTMTELFFPMREAASNYKTVAKAIVICAPLAGLLGTVGGMIEMFDSLASQEFFSQSGGIAGGISEALFTTQLGLTVAVPGLIVGRVLENKEEIIQKELDQVIEMVCALDKEEEKGKGDALQS